jgi:hypothetical protein
MQWHTSIREVIDAVNAVAQKHERDPVVLTATVLAAAIVEKPEWLMTAIQVFDRYGFDFRSRVPLPHAGDAGKDAA